MNVPFSSGPFLENDDVTKRKPSTVETYSIGHKRAKKKGKGPNGDYLIKKLCAPFLCVDQVYDVTSLFEGLV